MRNINLPTRYTCQCANALTPLVNTTRQIKQTDNASGFTWDSGESYPSFELSKKPKFAGWYKLEVFITASLEHLDASIYIDYKDPNLRTTIYPMHLRSGRRVKRIIYIPSSVEHIRFDPAEQQIQFDIKTLRFLKLSKRLALKLMRNKLQSFYPDSKHPLTLNLWKHYSRFYRSQKKSDIDYATWQEKRELPLLRAASHIEQTVTISVVAILSDPNLLPSSLSESLRSVQEQYYTRWQLILVVTPAIAELNLFKGLIQNILAEKNVDLLVVSNFQSAKVSDLLNNIETKYCLFLPLGTRLSKHALSIFVRHVGTHEQADICYADHDVLDTNGLRIEPSLKPDWNPDLLLSQNYIGECILFKKDLLIQCAQQYIDINGAWIYALLIDAVFKKFQVTHIPLILSHLAQRSSVEIHTKQLAVLKEKIEPHQAIAQHGNSMATFKVTWPLKTTPPLVSIIIPTRDGMEILKRAIDSILSLTVYPFYEIIIIDNQSRSPKTIDYLSDLTQRPNFKILKYDKPFNYSAINNFAAKHAQGEILALLNNDVEVITPTWLQEMVSHSVRPDIGCVGAMLYYPNNRVQHAGVIVGLGGCAGHSHKFYPRGDTGYDGRLMSTQNYSAVTGACLVVRKSLYDRVGGLNADHLHVAFNDVDLCLKIQTLGYRNIWTPWAELYHHESVSRGLDDTKKKRNRMKREVNYMKKTWRTSTITDRYYHIYLTRIREDFSLGL